MRVSLPAWRVILGKALPQHGIFLGRLCMACLCLCQLVPQQLRIHSEASLALLCKRQLPRRLLHACRGG